MHCPLDLFALIVFAAVPKHNVVSVARVEHIVYLHLGPAFISSSARITTIFFIPIPMGIGKKNIVVISALEYMKAGAKMKIYYMFKL